MALAGLTAGYLTDSAAPDGFAAIAVGVLLTAVAIKLGRRNEDLLTLRADSPGAQRHIYEVLTSDPRVAGVGRVTTMFVGPHRLFVVGEIQPAKGSSADELCELIDTLRLVVHAEIPRIAVCVLMPVRDLPDEIDLSGAEEEYWALRFPGQDQA